MATTNANENDIKKLQTGTTTVGIACSDGVVLASDKRATMGYFIASKKISDADWQEFQPEELIVFRNGKMIYSNKRTI